MSATTRCAELGITLPPVAAPVADYVPAIQTGSQILTSGQLPFVDGELTAVGKVGDAVSAEQAAEAARAAALNAIAAAAEVAGGLDAIKRIVRVVVFVRVPRSASSTSRQLVTSGRSRSKRRLSRSVIPPQTPHSSRLSRASARHSGRTRQSVQIRLARRCSFPSGKRASAIPRQFAWSVQSSASLLSTNLTVRDTDAF